MFKTDPYQNNAKQYDKWFEKNQWVYDAELRAVRSLFIQTGQPCIEVGVGTGRFAAPLGIKIAIEPSGDKLMIKYQDIIEAKELLNLPERASMEEIKSSYRKLISQWHPDKCNENNEKCNEMTKKIIAAYKTVIIYCNQYKYSFAKEEVRKYLSDEDWWFERFGNDPLWGNINKPS